MLMRGTQDDPRLTSTKKFRSLRVSRSLQLRRDSDYPLVVPILLGVLVTFSIYASKGTSIWTFLFSLLGPESVQRPGTETPVSSASYRCQPYSGRLNGKATLLVKRILLQSFPSLLPDNHRIVRSAYQERLISAQEK